MRGSCCVAYLLHLSYPHPTDRRPRTELVRTNQPLSSDAFSAWGIGDRESVMEVQMATARLFNQEIPRVARLIDTLKEDALSPQDLITLVHQNGINVRHLGRLRSLTQVRAELLLPSVTVVLWVACVQESASLVCASLTSPADGVVSAPDADRNDASRRQERDPRHAPQGYL